MENSRRHNYNLFQGLSISKDKRERSHFLARIQEKWEGNFWLWTNIVIESSLDVSSSQRVSLNLDGRWWVSLCSVLWESGRSLLVALGRMESNSSSFRLKKDHFPSLQVNWNSRRTHFGTARIASEAWRGGWRGTISTTRMARRTKLGGWWGNGSFLNFYGGLRQGTSMAWAMQETTMWKVVVCLHLVQPPRQEQTSLQVVFGGRDQE